MRLEKAGMIQTVTEIEEFRDLKLESNPKLKILNQWYFMWSPTWIAQLKLYTGYKLISTIFCCLWVCEASVTSDQISTFSNIYRHTSPMLNLYHVIPSSASFYWPSTTKYQTISPYTDPVPAGSTYNSSFREAQLNNFSFYDSFDESRTVYLV